MIEQLEQNISGMVFVDKSANLTSAEVVRTIKKALQTTRVGHLGTLDPFATGLLPVMIGSTTRLCEEFMDFDKQYLFTITLGIETDTLDPMGAVLKTAAVPEFSEEKIIKILELFTGTITQVPPVYSALKMNGRPLYEYMRATGKLPNDIKTKTRIVNIQTCELIAFTKSEHKIKVRVKCSKGTYVRSLARDIAQALGTVGMCSELRREKIGSWCVSQDSILSMFDIKQLELSGAQQDLRKTLFKNLVHPTALLPRVSQVLFPQSCFDRLNTGNVFVFEKAQDSVLFDSISALQSRKIFASITKHFAPLFLAQIEHTSSETITIKPHKKII